MRRFCSDKELTHESHNQIRKPASSLEVQNRLRWGLSQKLKCNTHTLPVAASPMEKAGLHNENQDWTAQKPLNVSHLSIPF